MESGVLTLGFNRELGFCRHMARKRTDKEGECDVIGCSKPGLRSLAAKRFSSAVPDAQVPGSRRVRVCKDHYKKYRKKTKRDRKLERLDW